MTPLVFLSAFLPSSFQFPKQIKKGARIINVARGGVIDDAALARALDAGLVAGAALDVFEPEPPAADNPLINRESRAHVPTASQQLQLPAFPWEAALVAPAYWRSRWQGCTGAGGACVAAVVSALCCLLCYLLRAPPSPLRRP